MIRNVPPGLGEPCFDKLEAKLAHAMLSIPATKGFEIGSGFKGTVLEGHQHNDPWVKKNNGHLGTSTNHSGGIQVRSIGFGLIALADSCIIIRNSCNIII